MTSSAAHMRRRASSSSNKLRRIFANEPAVIPRSQTISGIQGPVVAQRGGRWQHAPLSMGPQEHRDASGGVLLAMNSGRPSRCMSLLELPHACMVSGPGMVAQSGLERCDRGLDSPSGLGSLIQLGAKLSSHTASAASSGSTSRRPRNALQGIWNDVDGKLIRLESPSPGPALGRTAYQSHCATALYFSRLSASSMVGQERDVSIRRLDRYRNFTFSRTRLEMHRHPVNYSQRITPIRQHGTTPTAAQPHRASRA
jgi:hypothetical protein